MLKPRERFSHERMLFRERERGNNPSTWTAVSRRGMVATAHYLATAAGAEMLARGGDAADAAVAASLALGVCEPAGSGLAGMTMALVHRADSGATFALAGACRAPKLATPEAVAGGKRYRGHRSVAVPMNAAVLEKLHAAYGRLPRSQVFGPAVRYAEEGFPITPIQHALATRYQETLRRGSAGRLFLDAERHPLPPETILRQPALARTLQGLAERGFRDFYEGEIARQIGDDMRRSGGFLREEDLRGAAILEKEPIGTLFDGLDVFTLGPPGGGLALLQMLNVFSEAAGSEFDPDTPEGAVLLAGVIRRARLDRRLYRLKTGAESAGEAAALISRDYAEEAARALRGDLLGAGETSHLSVADCRGNLVSMTQSIERSFGAAEIHPNLGFLYNGFLRAFKIQNQRHPHYLRPGAVARSNACPTLLLKNGEPWGAIGNTGSERLASGILQVLTRLRRQPPFEAVLAPRLHCTPRGIVMLEAERFPPETLEEFAKMGLKIKVFDSYSFRAGGLNLVVKHGDGFCGVSEPRRDGTAAGPEEFEDMDFEDPDSLKNA